MSEWWLFRNTRIENINEQYEIARKHLPDTTHWLGSEHNYLYIKCCDVARSVYSDGDILKGEISPRRPIQSGDTLYVANIICSKYLCTWRYSANNTKNTKIPSRQTDPPANPIA